MRSDPTQASMRAFFTELFARARVLPGTSGWAPLALASAVRRRRTSRATLPAAMSARTCVASTPSTFSTPTTFGSETQRVSWNSGSFAIGPPDIAVRSVPTFFIERSGIAYISSPRPK
jgi:hypothetical protein